MKTLINIFRKYHGILLILLFVSVIFLPIITGFNIINLNNDVITGAYPFTHFFQQFIKTNSSIPLWSSSVFGGYPVHTEFAGSFLPLNWLTASLFNDSVTIYHFQLYLNFLFTSFFTYIFLRDLKLKKLPSVFGSLIYSLSYFLLSGQNCLAISISFWILPALLWSLRRSYYKSRIFYLFLSTGFLAIAFLSGFPQYNAYIIFVGFLYYLHLEHIKKSGLNLKKTLFTTLRFFLINVIALLIALPQIKPSLIALLNSERSAGFTPWGVLKTGISMPFDLINLIIPLFKTNLGYLFSSSPIFIGYIPLFLLIVFFFKLRGKNTSTPTIRFFFFILLFSFFASLRFSPLSLLIQYIPIFNIFHMPQRWFFISIFSIAIICAFSLQKLPLLKKDKWINLINIIGITIITTLLSANVIIYFFSQNILNFIYKLFDKYYESSQLAYSLTHYHSFLSKNFEMIKGSISINNPTILISLIFLSISILILNLHFSKKLKYKIFSLLIIFITFINIAVIVPFYGLNFTQKKQILLTEPTAAKIIKNHHELNNSSKKFRYYTFLSGEYAWFELENKKGASPQVFFEWYRETIYPNLNQLYSIDSISGYSILTPRRQREILYKLLDERASFVKIKQEPIHKVPEFLKNINLLPKLNVEYIISPFKLNSKIIEEISSIEITSQKIPIYIYHVKGVYPRIYFAEKLILTSKNAPSILDKMIKYDKPQKIAIIECDNNCPSVEKNVDSISTKIETIYYKDGEISLKTDSNKNQILVLQEGNSNGWIAYLDDKKVPIYKTNYIFQSIIVPKGTHNILWRYEGIKF